MYALTIIETDTYRQALLCRTVMEGEGWPTVAATVTADGETNHLAATSAPNGAVQSLRPLIMAYDQLGDEGLERCKTFAAKRGARNAAAVPAFLRDEVRNALLHTIYHTATDVVHVTQSEPAYSTLTPAPTEHHDPGDEDTKPTHNPGGGGFDGECIDKYDQWKPSRDIGNGIH